MQAVGPQYERRHAAKIDRAPARRKRPSAANGDTVTVVRKKSLPEKNLAFPVRQRIDSLWKCFLPSDDETVRVECAGAGKKFAVSAVTAVRIATSVQCMQNDTVVSERKRRSSNKRCNNFVVKGLSHQTPKTTGQEIELGRARGVSLRVEDALVLYTSAQARKKKGDAKIQARPTLTPVGTRRRSEHSG